MPLEEDCNTLKQLSTTIEAGAETHTRTTEI